MKSKFKPTKEFRLERLLDDYISAYERTIKPRLELPPRKLVTSTNYFQPENKGKGFFR